MARKTGSQRRKARATRTEDNKKKRATKIQKEIDRIKSGGKTYWKSKEDSLTSLKNKLKVATGKSSKPKSKLGTQVSNLKERVKQQSTKEARMARRNKRLAKKGIRIPKKK